MTRLVPKPCRIWFERSDVVEDDFYCTGNRDCEDEANGAPEPSPEQKRNRNRQRIKLKAMPQNLGIEQVQGEQVQSQDGDHQDYDVAGCELPDAYDHGRNERKQDAEIRNEAEEAADRSHEIEKWQPQSCEDGGAHE